MRYVTFFTLICFSFFYTSFAGIIYVPNDTTSIQGGIHLANVGDTVLVADGTYLENINFKGKAITVASLFIMDGDTNHINNTIIDGSQPSHPDSGSVVYFVSGEDTTSVICGFTITNGTGTNSVWSGVVQRSGGGIYILSGGKIVNNNIVSNQITTSGNVHGIGAGIDATGYNAVNIIIQDNIISDNIINGRLTLGGGVILETTGSIDFENNRLERNILNANNGQCSGSAMFIYGDTQWNGSIVIGNNIISNNLSISTNAALPSGGGAIEIQNCSPILYNNIISGNSTPDYGGGIMIYHYGPYGGMTNPIILNNTITENRAGYGGAVALYSDPTPNIDALLMNCILWGDSADTTINKEIYIQSGQATIVYSDIQDTLWPGAGNISKEPMLRSEDYHLSDSSSCIGAGTLSYQFGSTTINCPSTCYLGRARPSPSGSNPDIGACESLLPSPIVGLENLLSDNLPKTYSLSQNYPNPFNPTTTIEFDLPKTSEVTLKVFNILGEEVAILVSDRLSYGSYSYEWDASNLASGVYLYRLEAQGFVQTKKMVLMK